MSERPDVDGVFSGDPKEKPPTKKSEPIIVDYDEQKKLSFNNQVSLERVRQQGIGFTRKHDKKSGIHHLLELAYSFIYQDDSVKAAAMILAAKEISRKKRRIPGDLTWFFVGFAISILLFIVWALVFGM